MAFQQLFDMMNKYKSSDLHIKSGQPPVFRVNGQLNRQKTTPLTTEQCQQLLEPMMTPRQLAELNDRGNVDFAYEDEQQCRFRFNVFRQRGSWSAAIRRVNMTIPDYDQLNLPETMAKCAKFESGLVLVGGITGSGKTSTLAAVLNDINKNRRCHILTIEDPVEYVFHDELAIVNQREVGSDVEDFKDALRAGVRQDPDVMLIGEMRDAETFETALTAAETGHLVFGTVHSSGAAQTIGRLLDLFPEEKHTQIRTSLSFNLRAVINQKLIACKKEGIGAVPAVETMFLTPTIGKLLMDGEDGRMAEAIVKDTENGCESFNQALKRLVDDDMITKAAAMKASPNADELKISLSGINISGGGIV